MHQVKRQISKYTARGMTEREALTQAWLGWRFFGGYVGPLEGYVRPIGGHVGTMLSNLWLGWQFLEAVLDHLQAMLGQLEC